MMEQMNLDVLSQLFAQIERAWFDNRDRTLVYRLSEQHPEFREQLYEFFEDLVLGPEECREPEIIEAEERVSHWLQSTGLKIAATAAARERSATSGNETSSTPPSLRESLPTGAGKDKSTAKGEGNWLIFLRRRTKQTVPNLAGALQNVTTEYLALISRYPNIVPFGVRAKLAEDVQSAWGIPVTDSFNFLSDQPNVVRAASRLRPFDKEPETFEELLNRSALTREQKVFWLEYASSGK
jgi:hypothetical protein